LEERRKKLVEQEIIAIHESKTDFNQGKISQIINLNRQSGSFALELIRNNMIKFQDVLMLFDQIELKQRQDNTILEKYNNFIKEKEHWTDIFKNQAETLEKLLNEEFNLSNRLSNESDKFKIKISNTQNSRNMAWFYSNPATARSFNHEKLVSPPENNINILRTLDSHRNPM